MKISYTNAVSLVLGIIIGSLGIFYISHSSEPTTEERITEFYKTENAAVVSPHSLRKHMAEGTADEVIIVDLRSKEEYEKEHIISAINIPAYSDPETSAYGDVERIVNSFKEVVEENPNKEIIAYCYSHACMTSRKIGQILAEHDIYVKHLGIGWNEWRYDWNMWNHDGEASSTVEAYIQSGAKPGVMEPTELISPCDEGAIGC